MVQAMTYALNNERLICSICGTAVGWGSHTATLSAVYCSPSCADRKDNAWRDDVIVTLRRQGFTPTQIFVRVEEISRQRIEQILKERGL